MAGLQIAVLCTDRLVSHHMGVAGWTRELWYHLIPVLGHCQDQAGGVWKRQPFGLQGIVARLTHLHVNRCNDAQN